MTYWTREPEVASRIPSPGLSSHPQPIYCMSKYNQRKSVMTSTHLLNVVLLEGLREFTFLNQAPNTFPLASTGGHGLRVALRLLCIADTRVQNIAAHTKKPNVISNETSIDKAVHTERTLRRPVGCSDQDSAWYGWLSIHH